MEPDPRDRTRRQIQALQEAIDRLSQTIDSLVETIQGAYSNEITSPSWDEEIEQSDTGYIADTDFEEQQQEQAWMPVCNCYQSGAICNCYQNQVPGWSPLYTSEPFQTESEPFRTDSDIARTDSEPPRTELETETTVSPDSQNTTSEIIPPNLIDLLWRQTHSEQEEDPWSSIVDSIVQRTSTRRRLLDDPPASSPPNYSRLWETTFTAELSEYLEALSSTYPLLDYSTLEDVRVVLTESQYANYVRQSNNKTLENCLICMNSEQDELISILPCGHEFHEVCIKKWLQEYAITCPTCRMDVRESSKKMN
jgi:hypothetical protein